MNSSPMNRGIRILLSIFRDYGWRDEANAAMSIFEALIADNKVLDSSARLGPVIPDLFLMKWDIEAADVYAALTREADSLRQVAAEARVINYDPIIQISDIDSFSRVSEVAATDVASFANPLDLLEDIVERIIAKIIGEPYLVKDWGGELDDMYTGQIILGGRNIQASFLLKGSGLRGSLKPKNLGKNGDQITRMMAQPADLYVVQHVDRVDPSVRKQLRDAVLARRAEGRNAVVGTVWDGVDTGHC